MPAPGRRPLLAASALAAWVATSSAATSDWESVSRRDGLSIEWRAVPGSAVHEVRATGLLAHPPERLLALIGDVDHYPEFMPPTERVRVLRRDGDSMLVYVGINPPLVSRRDYCVRATVSRLPDGTLEDRWVQTDELCPPPPKGTIRVRHTAGHWRLSRQADGRALVEYQAIFDPGGALPTWIVNRATAGAARDLLRALGRAATDARYGRCDAGQFGCPANHPTIVKLVDK
jgi:ribosome-associated toxin RatA of RatAB toxin-antitoxin module